jgi:hypothetical protein
MLNVKNPKVYDSVEKFVAHVNNYGRGTALQEPELTVRYAEYLKSQGYDAISTTTERMQHDLVFDPKQVVVVED